jgi:hypothetical protein
LAAAMAAVVTGCGQKVPTAEEANVAHAQNAVRAKLRDPGSAQFGYIKPGKPGVMCGRVNSKNGFGGYAGSQQFVAVVDPTLSNIPIDDAGTYLEHDENGHMVEGQWQQRDFGRDLWRRYC